MNRRSLLVSLAAGSLAAGLVAGAAAAHHPRTIAYSATLAAVERSGAAGTARLLDKPGKGRDVLRVAVRGLTPRTAYAFHVHETDEPGNPSAEGHAEGHDEEHGHEEHGPVAGWRPTKLVANARGRATRTAVARGFEKHAGETYWVDVETTAGEVVACGVLKLRR